MKHRAILLVLACILISGIGVSAATTNPNPKGFVKKTIQIQGKKVNYEVFVPQNYTPGAVMPAIVFLNGSGECGTDGKKELRVGLGRAIKANPNAWPFIVIFPQEQSRNCDWTDEDMLVMSTLEKTRNEYKIDSTRLYLTGLSEGGDGTWYIAAKHPHLFAAIAPVCGEGDPGEAKKYVGTPVWGFNYQHDLLTPASKLEAMASAIKAAGGNCKVTIYPGFGHNAWDKAYREENLGQWFLQHRKSGQG